MINPAEIFEKISEDAVIPTVAHPHDAGVDLYASHGLLIDRGKTEQIHTGIKVRLPKGSVGLVVSRSGLAFKNRIRVFNSPGIIDSGYEGEIMVLLEYNGDNPVYIVEPGQRIAQMVIFEHQQLLCIYDSIRGTGGLGSSGS
jgi:dUTP pyrophosphatase